MMGLCNFLEKLLWDQAAADQCQLSREQVLRWEKSHHAESVLPSIHRSRILVIPPSALTRQDNTDHWDSIFITMLQLVGARIIGGGHRAATPTV